MAWQTELVGILRQLINDTTTPYTFINSRLEQVTLVAAQLIQHNFDFSSTYTIDFDARSLSPDPTTGTRDTGFMNLVVLKARCIIRENEYKLQSASAGWTVIDGPTRVSTSDTLKGYKDMWEQACKDFDTAKFEYAAGNLCPGEAILGPFASPTLTFTSDIHRDRTLY